MKRKNKLISSLAITGALFATLTFGSSTAHADTGAGVGGQGSGGNGVWHKIYGREGTQDAWKSFLAKTTNNEWANPSAVVASTGKAAGNPRLLSQCQNSRYIWYYGVSAGSSTWSTKAGSSHLASWVGGHPQNTNPGDWKAFREWDKQNLWGGGHTIIVCSGTYEDLTRDCSYDETRESQNTDVFTGVYSTNTTLTPNTRVEYSDYTPEQRSEWDSEHESQRTAEEKSNFGIWFDANINEIKSLDSLSGEAYKKKLAKLKAGAENAKRGDYIKHPVLKMSEKNQKGFAKGGVFTLSEGERIASARVSTKTKEIRRVTCTQKKQPNGNWGPKELKYGPWRDNGTGSTTPTTSQLSSMVPKRFWQIIHAICNTDGMNGVQNNTSTTVISGGDSVSKALMTKQYTSMSQLPLSDPNNSNGALSSTAHEDFYNSTACQIPPTYGLDCYSDPSKVTYGNGKVDAKNNKQDEGGKINNKYGAQGVVINAKGKEELMSSDAFTFFRNNKENDIRLDIWYPRAANSDFNDNNTKILSSEFHFDPNGTPIGDDMVGVKIGDRQLTGNDIKNGTNQGIMKNEFNVLTVKGAWASDEDKQHKANAGWIYSVNFKSNVPTELNSQGGKVGQSNVYTPVKFGCKMRLNSKGKEQPWAVGGQLTDYTPMSKEFENKDNYHADFGFVRSGSGLNQ